MTARTLTKSLGGMWAGSYGLMRCPVHDDRKPSLKIKDDPRKSDGIDLVCFAGCDWRAVKEELKRQGLIEDRASLPRGGRKHPSRYPSSSDGRPKINGVDAAVAKHPLPDDAERRSKFALQMWSLAVPLHDTLGWRYFTERRGLHIGTLDDLSHALRWHHGERAVIALMTEPLTNKPTGIHRTYLNQDATKREKKMLGSRGIIRLSPDENVTTGLGICEGIEDGLAILLSGWAPVWAATCAGEIEKFPVLPGIEALTVFADCDVVGTEAAQSCAERWRAKQCDVSIQYQEN